MGEQRRIRLLSEATINQIAAGEVVENPASVVKELVENALDAGASAISVETVGGGRGVIRVVDNGCGMAYDDLVLSFERHATSKLSDIEDLKSLLTLGFRGEALSSIAAISKMLIHTAYDEKGYELNVKGGQCLGIQMKPRQKGTTIEVKSLFFNTPVRKNFQKSLTSDRIEIHKVLTKFALCYQTVGFSWISEGKEEFLIDPQTPLKDRIRLLIGGGFSQMMLPVEQEEEPFQLSGFIASPSFHRPNQTGQYLFINRRCVHSSFVSRKVLEGYGTRLSKHRFPLFVLYFFSPQDLIDVNVHPQKKEVRICEEEKVGKFITRVIDKRLTIMNVPEISVSSSFETLTLSASEEKVPYSSDKIHQEKESPSPELFSVPSQKMFHFKQYLFFEDAKGIHLVDLKAARFRILYEQLLLKPEKTAIQQLLIPLQIETIGEEKMQMMENLLLLKEAGFSIRHFGGNTFIIDALPAFFELEEVLDFVYGLLAEGKLPQEKKFANVLQKSLRIHSSQLGKVIVDTLFKCSEPNWTPNGRPTYLLLTEKELEKLFHGSHQKNTKIFG